MKKGDRLHLSVFLLLSLPSLLLPPGLWAQPLSPFTANLRIQGFRTGPGGERERLLVQEDTGLFLRDRAGSTYLEILFSNPVTQQKTPLIILWDAANHRTYRVVPERKEVWSYPEGYFIHPLHQVDLSATDLDVVLHSILSSPVLEEATGTKEVQGFRCEGRRLLARDTTDEVCISPELQAVLFRKLSYQRLPRFREIEEEILEIENLQAGEDPDRRRFDLPPGYRVIDMERAKGYFIEDGLMMPGGWLDHANGLYAKFGSTVRSSRVKPGDILLAIDGTDLNGKFSWDVDALLGGDRSEPVTLTLRRKIFWLWEKEIQITLPRIQWGERIAGNSLGMRLTMGKNGEVLIRAFSNHLAYDSPAKEAGLKRGDRILKIDGVDLTGKSMQEVAGLLGDLAVSPQEKPSDGVTLTIERRSFWEGVKEREVTVARSRAFLPREPIPSRRFPVGVEAPPFEVEDLRGNRLRSADLQGKVVLLHFFWLFMDDTIKEVSNAYKDKGLELIGVMLNHNQQIDNAKAMRFIQKGKTPGHLVLDDGTFEKYYGIRGHPTTLLLDRSGKIVDIIRVDNEALKQKIDQVMKADR
ncbi:MAG: PDZ domain-containing protein [Candidatus Manganitrophaceae bacterium]